MPKNEVEAWNLRAINESRGKNHLANGSRENTLT